MFDTKPTEQEVLISSSSRMKPLIGVLLILVSLGVYVFLTRPVASGFDDIEAQIEAKNQETQNLKDKVSQFDQIGKALDLSTEVQRIEILKSVPVSMQQDQVIRDLIDVAKNNDIELNSISFGQGNSGKEGISALRVNASFEGYYSDLLNFLESIEQNARTLRVSAVNVQLNSMDESELKRTNFSLSMEAFYQE